MWVSSKSVSYQLIKLIEYAFTSDSPSTLRHNKWLLSATHLISRLCSFLINRPSAFFRIRWNLLTLIMGKLFLHLSTNLKKMHSEITWLMIQYTRIITYIKSCHFYMKLLADWWTTEILEVTIWDLTPHAKNYSSDDSATEAGRKLSAYSSYFEL